MSPKKLTSLIFTFLFLNLFLTSVAQKSSIYGKVVDKKNGETLIGVNVVIKGTTNGVSTDIDGKFQIKNLGPGNYSIVVSYVSYVEQIINDIQLEEGKNFEINIALEQNTQQLQAVEITATANRQSTATLLATLKNSTNIAVGISQDAIKRTPDKSTSEVLKRLSGTSVQNNKFVIIRGLNDRYNYAMMNGMPLSSTEADRKAVSFDIFPAPLIDNIIISKTAEPDLPGEFAGGIIQLNTRDIPEENSYSFTVGSGLNKQTTFKKFYHGEKGGKDWLGYDDGTRAMPDIGLSPDSVRALLLEPRVEMSKKFRNDWKIYEVAKAAPNLSLQSTLIQNFKLFGAETGLLSGITYNNSRKLKTVERKNYLGLTDTSATAGEYHYKDTVYTFNVLLGGMLNFAFKLNNNNKITLKNTYTQNADDKLTYRTGVRIADQTNIKADYIEYTSTHLLSSQLQGDHYLEKPKIKMQWGFSASNLYNNTPDFRRMGYYRSPEDTTVYYAAISSVPSPQSAGKVYSTLSENVFNESADISIPLPLLKGKQLVKGGTLQQQKERYFQARDFGYKIASFKFDYNSLLLPQDSLFMPEMISDSGFVIDELTNPYDKYNGEVHLSAYYIMLDNSLLKNLRVLWGMRYENFHQQLNSRNQADKRLKVDRTETDWMPSANLIWSVTEKMNVRLSASRTVSRPEFREIAPLNVYDFNTEANLQGNDSLVRGKIENFDARFEFFPGAAQMISITGFYKTFISPIEQTVSFQGSNRVYSFQNVNGATNYGAELEFRIKPSLFFKDVKEQSLLNEITLFANYAWIHSKIDVSNVLTAVDSVRPLQGQSPYVFNAGIQFLEEKTGFGLTAVFNQVGDRIDRVGGDNYFNIIESHRPVFDLQVYKRFLKKAEVKFTVSDLLNRKSVFYWDMDNDLKYNESIDRYIDVYQYGTSYMLSFSYTF